MAGVTSMLRVVPFWSGLNRRFASFAVLQETIPDQLAWNQTGWCHYRAIFERGWTEAWRRLVNAANLAPAEALLGVLMHCSDPF